MTHTLIRYLAILIALGLSGSAAAQLAIVETTNDHRLVRHAAGETQIPLTPQRIVSLNSTPTDGLVALGIAPVGIATFTGSDFISYEYQPLTAYFRRRNS